MTVRKPRFAEKAELVQTLVYFDGPQVALFRTDRNTSLIAVRVEHEKYNEAMFACEVSKATVRKYMNERFDLRYTFKFSERTIKYYMIDWAWMVKKIVKLEKASEAEIKNEDYYPETGFFAHHHTRDYVAKPQIEAEAQKYKIDGSWDASDFSRFYGRISDLYAIMTLASHRLVDAISEVDVSFVKSTVGHYLWRGGGSYVNFYDTLLDRIQSFVPLNVKKIRYSSPGFIELDGGRAQLDEIERLMVTFDQKYPEMLKLYNQIDKVLRIDGLKRAPSDAGFVSTTREAYIREMSFALMDRMEIDNARQLYEISGPSTLVFAKIVLSFFRRGRDLHRFYVEGRVQTGEEALRSVEQA